MTAPPVRLGLRENRGQFSMLVAVNAFVGATVGLSGWLAASPERQFGR
jgi:hypothetical protein